MQILVVISYAKWKIFLNLNCNARFAAWSQRVFVFDAHLIRNTSFMELFFF